MILVNTNFFSFAKILEFKKNEIRDIKLSKLIRIIWDWEGVRCNEIKKILLT